jgi:RNA polymerase sporulation-specific sigma factor
MGQLTERIARAQAGDKAERDALVAENLGLVHLVVRRFSNRNHDREELFQIGCIGLLKAVDRFDVTMQVAFSTYAVPMIAGEIRCFLRDDGMVRVSRSLKEQGYRIEKAKEALHAQLGREPNVRELADAAQLTVEETVMAMEANRQVTSVEEQPLLEQHADKEGDCDVAEEVVTRLVVEQGLALLNEVERRLITLRYFEEQTQREIGEALGMGQVQVSRMEKKILFRMRNGIVGTNEN